MKAIVFITNIFLILLSSFAFGEQKVTHGEYEVHYNAFSSMFLSLEVAKNYHIKRSQNRALLNIAILEKNDQNKLLSSKGNVTIKARNLLGQTKKITLQEVIESDAIYYLGTFKVSGNEDVIFEIEVVPENSKETIKVKYKKEFF